MASNILFLLCDHVSVLWAQYPRLGNAVIRTLCDALFRHSPLGSMAGNSDKALATALLLCLGEWCMKLEPRRLLEVPEYGEGQGTCLLLQVFTVSYFFKIVLCISMSYYKYRLNSPIFVSPLKIFLIITIIYTRLDFF